jgi:hypothetical protein
VDTPQGEPPLTGPPSDAEVRCWQARAGGDVVALIHALFVRLGSWRGLAAAHAGGADRAADAQAGVASGGFVFADGLESEQAWCNLWMLVLKALARIAHEPRFAPFGEAARAALERALLARDVVVPFPAAWRDCYDQVPPPFVLSGHAASLTPY